MTENGLEKFILRMVIKGVKINRLINRTVMKI